VEQRVTGGRSMVAMGVYLTIGLVIFAAILFSFMYFLWNVVTKDSVEYDLIFVWDGKFSREQIGFDKRK
jgi:hypothetical protein